MNLFCLQTLLRIVYSSDCLIIRVRDMGNSEDKKIEKLLHEGAAINPAHKSALWKKLQDGDTELSVEDLEGVIGGVSVEAQEFLSWPDMQKSFKEDT